VDPLVDDRVAVVVFGIGLVVEFSLPQSIGF
jgi:hypothetical protein